MKSGKINLHMNKRKALFVIVLFFCLSLLLNISFFTVLNSNIVQLNSLLRSRYIFSAFVQAPVGVDDYYQFDAGICFALSAEDDTRLNADILMQIDADQYTNNVNWNSGSLDTDQVAISKGIAQRNNLQIGDKLYSKHIVNGKIHEYTIDQILPDVSTARVEQTQSYNDGIIIMGYDTEYVDNISHKTLIFTNMSVEEFTGDKLNFLENIRYREDEIAEICRTAAPYILVALVLDTLLVVGMVLLLKKNIAHNFRRQITLGFKNADLNKAYNRSIYGIGMASILMSLIISALLTSFNGLCEIEYVFLILTSVIECVVLFIAASLSNRHLWRGR